MPSINNLVSVAILAAAIACEAMGAATASATLQVVFLAICGAAIALSAAVLTAGHQPWALAAAADMRAKPRLPGKAAGQLLALALMGWLLPLAVYAVALFLTYLAEKKT